MFKNAKIYLAGHTGLLGSALFDVLKQRGFTRVITRKRRDLDLTDRKAVNAFFQQEKPEYVFLAAGLNGGIAANIARPAEFFYVNIAIQNNVFHAAKEHGVRRLIFYASSCIYPKKCRQPMKEDYLLSGAPEETSQAYASAKIAGVVACRVYNQQYKSTRFIALVPNTMYGPNDNFNLEEGHVLSVLMRKFHEAKIKGRKIVTLWGSGTPRREFVFSRDIAEASLFAMLSAEKLENTPYNIGTGKDYSIKELAEKISSLVGFRGRTAWDKNRPDGAPRKLLDSSRFIALGWRPSVSFEDGLRQTYAWYLNQIK